MGIQTRVHEQYDREGGDGMKRGLLLLLVLGVLIVCGVSATPVNFTPWAAYGDAWKSNNDTYTIVMWNATGVHTWLATGNASSVDYLVVAGGGGGGDYRGGGGGGGGFLTGNISGLTGLQTIAVGDGGSGGTTSGTTQRNGTVGSNSSFANTTGGDGINAMGGGGGASGAGDDGSYKSKIGGSGGGGAGFQTITGSAGVYGQGFAGGNGATGYAGSGGGGGGGAGSTGVSAISGVAGSGGAGNFSTITGSQTCYAGGGGGGINTASYISGSATCGGGAGSNTTTGGAGISNIGGGGGGGAYNSGTFSGGNGGSGVVIISYITPTVVTPPTASFTCTPTTVTIGNSITCTDTSTGSPTNWTWDFNNGGNISTLQNPTYTYSHIGTYSVNLTVNNTAGSSSFNRSNYISVVNATGFTQQDLWQTGHYAVTLKITDSSNAPIPVVTVTDNFGQSYTTTNGTAFFTEDAGTVVFYFASSGYSSKSMSYIVDEDATHTVQLATAGTSNQNTWYTPWQVRIRVVDFYGKPLPLINVTANYVASTLPSTDTSWLVTAFGISSTVADDMVNSAKAMEGQTDDNGGLSFTMFKSLQYRLVIANATEGVASTKTLYPSDQEYVIYVRTTGQGTSNNTLAMRNATLPWYSLNTTHISLNMTYIDTSLCTSDLTFRVWFRDNGTEVHNTTWTGFGASYVYDNHTVPKAPIGTEYLWGYNATTVC